MAVLFPLYQWFTIQLAYWCNFHLTKTAIKQLEKIEMIKYNDTYRLSSALSRNQKKLLKAFNMNSGSILMEAQYIANILKKHP